jgi:hypothetical protein
MPYVSRKFTVAQNWNSFDVAYGETGRNGVSSVCGAGMSEPYNSEEAAYVMQKLVLACIPQPRTMILVRTL